MYDPFKLGWDPHLCMREYAAMAEKINYQRDYAAKTAKCKRKGGKHDEKKMDESFNGNCYGRADGSGNDSSGLCGGDRGGG